MTDGPDDLVDRLTVALGQPVKTIRKCETFLGEVIGAALERDPGDRVRSRNLTAKLLTRIVRDNRCAAVLSVTGYAVQSTTLVASVLEVAYTVGYIRDEVERANEWWIPPGAQLISKRALPTIRPSQRIVSRRTQSQELRNQFPQ